MPNIPTGPISTAETARRLEVSTSTVHNLVGSGDLTPIAKIDGIRGAMFFRPADVAKLARSRAKATKAKAS
jgi:hypothetical protein